MSTSGSPTRARASIARVSSPPDSVVAGCKRCCSKSQASSAALILAAKAGGNRPKTGKIGVKPSATRRSTVIGHSQRGFCGK
jgi:hypothetical protein